MRAGIAAQTPGFPRPRSMTRWTIAFGAILVALSFVAPEASGQFFGQNKVQYKRFNWKVLRTQHFDIHYYQGTEAAVQDAALMAERGYRRLSRILNHQIRARVPLSVMDDVIQPFPTFSEVFLHALQELTARRPVAA